jgi:hypothetical protein
MRTNLFVLHYEDNAMTDQCVLSLLDQAELAGAQIIVVDNGSPVPYSTDYPVTVYRHEQNYFLVEALSIAMRQFPSALYGLLNNDLICHPTLVSTMIDLFKDGDVGIAAPGSSDTGTGVLCVPYPARWGNVETVHVDNHCMFVAHDVVNVIGWPEVEGHTHRTCWAWNKFYCHQARQAGYKVIAALNTYVNHLGGGFNVEANEAGQKWLASRLDEKVAATL